MKCNCCQRKQKIMESFSSLNIDGNSFNVCSECINLIFKIRDFSFNNNKKEFEIARIKIMEKCKNDEVFNQWLSDFIKKHDKF